MNDFCTPLNRSRRISRSIQYFGILFMLITIIYSIIIMFLLIKGLTEAGSWGPILVLISCVPAYCYIISKGIWPILIRPFVRIKLTREGVFFTQPFRKERLLPWGAFQEICLIDDDIPRRDRQPPASLLLVKWEAPKTRRGRWNTTSCRYPDRIISVDFDAEVRAALRELCPHPIVDYRKHVYGKHSPAA